VQALAGAPGGGPLLAALAPSLAAATRRDGDVGVVGAYLRCLRAHGARAGVPGAAAPALAALLLRRPLTARALLAGSDAGAGPVRGAFGGAPLHPRCLGACAGTSCGPGQQLGISRTQRCFLSLLWSTSDWLSAGTTEAMLDILLAALEPAAGGDGAPAPADAAPPLAGDATAVALVPAPAGGGAAAAGPLGSPAGGPPGGALVPQDVARAAPLALAALAERLCASSGGSDAADDPARGCPEASPPPADGAAAGGAAASGAQGRTAGAGGGAGMHTDANLAGARQRYERLLRLLLRPAAGAGRGPPGAADARGGPASPARGEWEAAVALQRRGPEGAEPDARPAALLPLLDERGAAAAARCADARLAAAGVRAVAGDSAGSRAGRAAPLPWLVHAPCVSAIPCSPARDSPCRQD